MLSKRGSSLSIYGKEQPVSLSNRNTEAGAGRTGGRSHRSYSAALSRPVRPQPQPTIHVEVSQDYDQMQGKDVVTIIQNSLFTLSDAALLFLGVVSLWRW